MSGHSQAVELQSIPASSAICARRAANRVQTRQEQQRLEDEAAMLADIAGFVEVCNPCASIPSTFWTPADVVAYDADDDDVVPHVSRRRKSRVEKWCQDVIDAGEMKEVKEKSEKKYRKEVCRKPDKKMIKDMRPLDLTAQCGGVKVARGKRDQVRSSGKSWRGRDLKRATLMCGMKIRSEMRLKGAKNGRGMRGALRISGRCANV